MNKEELMIGDWVNYLNGELYPCEVNVIRQENIELKTPFSEFNAKFDRLRPIEINDEILERCGFHTAHDNSWYNPDIPFDLKRYGTDSLQLSLSGARFDLKYLHQLQHAARLVGCEIKYDPYMALKRRDSEDTQSIEGTQTKEDADDYLKGYRFILSATKDKYTDQEAEENGLTDSVLQNMVLNEWIEYTKDGFKLTKDSIEIRDFMQGRRNLCGKITDWFLKHIIRFKVTL